MSSWPVPSHLLSASSSPAAWRAAWAAATRRASRSAEFPSRSRAGPPVGTMRRHHNQRQWRPRTLRRHRLHRRTRQRAGLSRPACRHPGRLDWLAAENNGIEWLLSVPGDCPFLPDDLVERLHIARVKMGAGVPLACARSGDGATRWWDCGRWRCERTCAKRWSRKACARSRSGRRAWRRGGRLAGRAGRPYLNVNTPEDAARAERIALQHQGI